MGKFDKVEKLTDGTLCIKDVIVEGTAPLAEGETPPEPTPPVVVQGSTTRLAMTTSHALTENNTWQDVNGLSGTVAVDGKAKFDASISISPHNTSGNAEVKVRILVNNVEQDVKRWYRSATSGLHWADVYLKSPDIDVLVGQTYKVQVFASSTIETGLTVSGGNPGTFNSWLDYTKMILVEQG